MSVCWFVLLSASVSNIIAAEQVTPAFPGAEGFGAAAKGGAGGAVLRVTSLEDEPNSPRRGSLRWAVQQKGPRVIDFDVAGNIRLKAPLAIREPFVTIDGGDAPGDGVCLCDHSLICRKTHDVVVRHLRIRRGDVTTLEAVTKAGLQRPKGSQDLDCVSLDDSRNILFDHCSLSWSCDEIFGIVRCENVTIQWCIIAEPLSNPRIHPYGDHHAFGLNLSANTLSVHHCLIARFVMRGPQFEANDVRRGMGWDVKMESVNNVIFDYERSGSRYTAGIEDHPEEAVGAKFAFQFLSNFYINPDPYRPEIEAATKHGVTDQLRIHASGNIGPNRPTNNLDEWACIFTESKQPILKRPIRKALPEIQKQMSTERLFAAPIPVTVEKAQDAYDRVLSEAGCRSSKRDSADARIVEDVRQRRFGKIVRSQNDVGGWPALK